TEKFEGAVPVEPHVGKRADLGVAREIDASIDARRFTFRASEPCSRAPDPPPQRVAIAQIPRLFDQHAYRLPATLGAGSLRCNPRGLAQPDESLAPPPNARAVRELRRRRPFFRAVLEEADAVELCALDPALEILHMFLAFAGKTDDEGRAHRDARHARAK